MKVKILFCPIRKYRGQIGEITKVIKDYNGNSLYKVKVGDVSIRNYATDDCLEFIE